MASAKRKDISSATQRALFDAAGRQCTMCRRSLDIEGSAQHIGEMGHIVPSSPRGPRSEMPRPAEIDGFGNLMLLCPSCHRTIDKAPKLWPGDELFAVKAEHEGWVAVERTRPTLTGVSKEEPLEVGQIVEVGGVTYEVVGHPLEEWSANRTAVIFRTFAFAPDGGRVWVRRVVSRGSSPEALRWRAEFAEELELLADALPRLPRLRASALLPETAVLVTEVPSFTTMGGFYDGRGRDPETVRVLSAGLSSLCSGLRSLHARGLAHGELGLGSILADRRGRLFLRDTGRAVSRSAEPAEDVRTLAELIHLVVTGRPPVPLVSPSVLNPAVPERFALALVRALSPDPAARGNIDTFGADLRR